VICWEILARGWIGVLAQSFGVAAFGAAGIKYGENF